MRPRSTQHAQLSSCTTAVQKLKCVHREEQLRQRLKQLIACPGAQRRYREVSRQRGLRQHASALDCTRPPLCRPVGRAR